MKRNKLFLNPSPSICGYASHAKALAILSVDDDYLPWYYSNYIQTCCKKDFSTEAGVPFDFFIAVKKDYNYYLNNPWLFSQVIRRELLSWLSGDDLIRFIVQCIDNGFYVDLFMNEFYVPNRAPYRERDYYHDNLIFGYDADNESFDLFGFNGRFFATSVLSYEEFLAAYRSCPIEKFYKSFYLYHVEKIRGGSPDETYQFDAGFVVQSLRDYVRSTNSSVHFAYFNNPTASFAYGLDCYASLHANLREEPHRYDLRPLQILYEHKSAMVERCKYLFDIGLIGEKDYAQFDRRFRELRKQSVTLRNLQIKNKLSSRNDFSFLSSLLDMPEIEERLLIDLIHAIK
ncbi:hypothetical protein [Cohnella cholangitidis]|uniref:Uncharacterized protein n=1 Tax=Cohnella cholangitidis TaxID=2598458 RepID=A0A7G5C427_9BACL|nr:hypothetical protein [Cohnella cholangitidis]QMV43961.1 hypothetical protein FPL14_24375 [Cohnella cholangitidis]